MNDLSYVLASKVVIKWHPTSLLPLMFMCQLFLWFASLFFSFWKLLKSCFYSQYLEINKDVSDTHALQFTVLDNFVPNWKLMSLTLNLKDLVMNYLVYFFSAHDIYFFNFHQSDIAFFDWFYTFSVFFPFSMSIFVLFLLSMIFNFIFQSHILNFYLASHI